MEITIIRTIYDKEGVVGIMLKDGVELCKTLERPFNNNKRDNPNTLENDSSCIPEGVYNVVKRGSPKYGRHFHIKDVPNRDMILIHSGNCIDDILGCVLVGKNVFTEGTLFRGKKYKFFAVSSKITMQMLLRELDEEFKLVIKSKDK